MHAFTHTLAHRAPSATRPRVRWQPYNPSSSQPSSIRSPSTTQFSTPTSSTSSPPSNTLREPKFSHTLSQKETPLSRESSKKQFAVGLVDQAVKTLGEIWRPQDIPPIFLTAFRAPPAGGSPEEPFVSSRSMSTSTLSVSIDKADAQSSIPIKGFVHEVIRRSRTSGCVLQTALCYLEAIRPKIPDLLQRKRSGQSVCRNTYTSSRILPTTEVGFRPETEHCALGKSGIGHFTAAPSLDIFSSVRLADIQTSDAPPTPNSQSPQKSLHQASYPQDDSSNTPSPLLCPRRTFLASLILASKFMQDKCYSNRAWSKLSGLPARELSCCERALGDALNWRLWVGKTPAQNSLANVSSPIGTAVSSSQPVVRSQSENNVLSMSVARSSLLVRHDPRLPNTTYMSRVLHRSSTLPAEVFAMLPPSRTGSFSHQNSQEISEKLVHSIAMPKQVSAVLSFTGSTSQSPSPDIPGLSYSPSTESSSGDRTIQMSTFFDDPIVHLPQVPAVPESLSEPNISGLRDFQISPLDCPKINQLGKTLIGSLDLLAVPSVVAGIDLRVNTLPASNLPRLLDGEIGLIAQ